MSRAHRAQPRWLALLVAIAAISAYLNIFSNQFLGDDNAFLSPASVYVDRPDITAVLSGLNPPRHEGSYRPLRGLTIVAFSRILPPTPTAYHFLSLLVHSSNSVLVFFLASRLQKSYFVSTLTALFFALHPLHVEAIAGMTSTFDTLGTTWLFVSLLLYLHATPSPTRFLPRPFSASLIFAGLAFFTYPPTLVLPLLIYGMDAFLRPSHPRPWARYLPYVLLAGLYLYIRLFIVKPASRDPFPHDSALRTKLVSLLTIAYSLFLVSFPYKLSINHLLPGNLLSHSLYSLNRPFLTNLSLTQPPLLISFLLLLSLIGLAVSSRRRYPVLGFSIIWFILTLLPTLNALLPNPNFFAEKYLYLPVFGWSFAFASLLSLTIGHLTLPLRRVLLAGVLVLLGLYLGATLRRNQAWTNELALLSIDSSRQPTHPILLYQLGLAYQHVGLTTQAAHSYQRTLHYAPAFAYPWLNLGYLAQASADATTAAAFYHQATLSEPLIPDPWHNLGILALQTNRPASASAYFSRALEIDPGFSPSLSALSALRGQN